MRPDDTFSVPTVLRSYDDTHVPLRVTTLRRETSGDPSAMWPITTFYDRLGRRTQTKAEAQDATATIVTDVSYNAQGLVAEEFVPRLVQGSATFWDYVTPPEPNPNPKTSHTYDARGARR